MNTNDISLGRALILAVALTAILGVPSWADWDEGDSYKMHFPQLPDPEGWDIEVLTSQHELADDWLCTETGPVRDVHFWVSWSEDCLDFGGPLFCLSLITQIHVNIYSDLPVGHPQNPYPWSIPGELLWARDFVPGEFTFREYGTGPEGFADPQQGYEFGWSIGPEHNLHQQINIENIQDPFIQNEGTIYWLGIWVLWETTLPPIGWKTSLEHFNDAAVYWTNLPPPNPPWMPLITPPGPPWPPPWNQDLDLAFVITSDLPRDTTVYKADWPNYAPSGMPDFSQDHTGWPPTWCGPTSVADSFWWFDSELECDRDRTSGDATETESNNACYDADLLGEVPPLSGFSSGPASDDWFVFTVPDSKQARECTVTVSTCALRQPGDADTVLDLYEDCDSGTGNGINLIASNDDGCPPSRQSEITVDLTAGQSYYVRVTRQPAGGTAGPYTLSLGIDCYPLVERYPESAVSQGTPDDHSEYNPSLLIPDLAQCMNTDDVWGTGSGHRGTRILEMQACIDQWLIAKGLDDAFTEQTVFAPTFEEVEEEIERSEDVVLLLGFYWSPDGQNWVRCGGHYVTSAGVDSPELAIMLSDPALNNAEPPLAGNGGPGRVRGTDHTNHAPTTSPPPSHDDTENISHDRYPIGPPMTPWATWAIPSYATAGGPTTCLDVARWCMGFTNFGQNPPEPPQTQEPCFDPDALVSVEVEAMVDVSPLQTPLCVFLTAADAWPFNLRVRKTPCQPVVDAVVYDVIRGKLCNPRFRPVGPTPEVDLGHVQCMYDDTSLIEWDELSPDDTNCFGAWFYLARQDDGTNPDYGNASPGGEPRYPSSGGCP